MREFPTPQFDTGEVAWFADGRSGEILQAVLNPVEGMYQYEVEGIGRWFLERHLYHEDPTFQEPPVDVEPDVRIIPDVPAGTVTAEILQDSIDRLTENLEMVTANLGSAIQSVFEFARDADQVQREAMTDLQVAFVTQQSETEDRLREFDSAADESGSGGVFGFFKRFGAAALSPFEAIRGALGQYILDEVHDGLTR